MTRPFFARDRVTDFDLFNRHAEVVIQKLKERFAQGEAVDFQVRTLIPHLPAILMSPISTPQDIMSRFAPGIIRLPSLNFTRQVHLGLRHGVFIRL
jgi:hypothetical protein